MEWNNRKTLWYEAVRSALNFPFFTEVSQNCFVFDVVNFDFFRKSCRNSSQSARSPTLPVAQKKDAQEAYKLLQGLYQATKEALFPAELPVISAVESLQITSGEDPCRPFSEEETFWLSIFKVHDGEAGPVQEILVQETETDEEYSTEDELKLRFAGLHASDRGGANSDEESTPTDLTSKRPPSSSSKF
jgi:hypothetical protein